MWIKKLSTDKIVQKLKSQKINDKLNGVNLMLELVNSFIH